MKELIITHSENIARKYGEEGREEILNAVGNLQGALSADDIESELVLLDEPTSEDWRLSSERMLDLINEHDPDQILIIGGDEIIPFCRMPDPLHDPMDDGYIYSDSIDTWWTLDNRPGPGVGRMPDDGTDDPNFIVEQLERAAEAHRQGGITLKAPACVFSAELWEQSTQQVIDDAGVPNPKLYTSPPWGLTLNHNITSLVDESFICPESLLYFALHGLHCKTRWWGHPKNLHPWIERSLPDLATVVNSDLVAAAAPVESVACAAVCQGAYILCKNTESSLALRFIKEGVLCFIAPITRVYEYVPDEPGPLEGIDLLFADVLKGLVEGIPTGQALVEAKRMHRLLYPPDVKNVHSLVLYGDPGLKIKSIENVEEVS